MEINAGIFDSAFRRLVRGSEPLLGQSLHHRAPALQRRSAGSARPTSESSFAAGCNGERSGRTSTIPYGPPTARASIPRCRKPVVGEVVNPVNNITLNTNGKAYGARFRVYPLPLDSNLGRLELGASTLDGKWLNGNWYNAWGVDFAYLRGSLQARGEYIEMYRQMPNSNADNRQGWYVQFGYFLNQVHLPGFPRWWKTSCKSWNRWCVTRGSISARWWRTRFRPCRGSALAARLRFSPRMRVRWHWRWITGWRPRSCGKTNLTWNCPRRVGRLSPSKAPPHPRPGPEGATPNDVVFQSQLSIGF